MGKILSGYIRTPAELDAAARALERSLLQTTSPQKRFLLIAEFHSHVRELPPAWLAGYVGFLAPVFIELVRLPYLRSFPPDVWTDAYDLIGLFTRQDWGNRISGLDEAREEVLRQTILAHAFVSSLRELHAFLRQHEVVSAKLTSADWTQVFGASSTGFGLFEAYVRILRTHEVSELAGLEEALSIWRTFRERQNAVSVILLEEENYSRYSAGRVLPMDIVPQAGIDGDGHINNILGDSGYGTIKQLHIAESLSAAVIKKRFSAGNPSVRYSYSAHESSAELIGGSLGLAVMAGLLAERTQRLNLSQRWILSPTVACTGSILPDGTVEPGTWDSLEAKLRLAFHSPLEKIVIPAAHREAALRAVQLLQRDFPNRILEILGVARVEDLPEVRGVFSVTHRNRFERTREVIRQSNAALLGFFVLLFLAGGSYLVYKVFYDYPNLELTRGLAVGNNSIVYNPKSEMTWCFRDKNEVRDAILPFGDLEVGDGFTRTLWLWNMTPAPLNVRIGIEGLDSSEWYLNSGDELITVESSRYARFSIMFAPKIAATEKKARLVIRAADNEQELYSLQLTGSAGRPLPAGYALHFDGIDDILYFGERSTAFDITATPARALTFECWFRPARENSNFLLLHNGFSKQGEPGIDDIILGLDSLRTIYCKIGSEIIFLSLPPEKTITAGNWNHIALTFSLPLKKIALYLNGEVIDARTTDFLMEGIAHPHVTIGGRSAGEKIDLHFEGEMDEVRLWHAFRSVEETRRDMYASVDGLTSTLAGYWDMDTAVETEVFNANKRAHSGELHHRPYLVRSDLALIHDQGDCTPVATDVSGEHGVMLHAGRYLACVRPVLPRFGDATIALRFLQTARPAIHFYYCRKDDGWISFEEMYTFTRLGRKHLQIMPGWHDAVMLVESSGRMRLFIDGVPTDTNRVTRHVPYDWHADFEGILLGFLFDKKRQLNSGYYNLYFPALNHARGFAALHFWDRLLTMNELRSYSAHEAVPRNGLAASWTIDGLPDGYNNFIDRMHGAQLHVKKVKAWE